jgi:hypothetical protein
MKNQKGQSTIEFILTFTMVVSFILLFLKMTLNYTSGYMLHHAVYMASRSFLVHDSQVGQSESEISAQDDSAVGYAAGVFAKYLPTGLISGFDNHQIKFNLPSNPTLGSKAFVGAYAEFQQPFSSGLVGGKDIVTFRSESFLGREPTRAESYNQTCEAMKKAVGGEMDNKCSIHTTLDDNGG